MHRVTALVDWDTARRLVPCRTPNTRHIEAVIDRLQTGISNYIRHLDGRANYRVYWRVYHGWHQGRTKTQDRVLFDAFLTTASARTLRNISFSSDFELSGTLSCGSTRSPIVDTLRMDGLTRQTKQKMVDTLLVCDLLHLARTRENALLVVIANDDDFVPALHTAEAWKASVIMLHDREHINDFLSLDGIASRIAP
jgi:hypothetical protein